MNTKGTDGGYPAPDKRDQWKTPEIVLSRWQAIFAFCLVVCAVVQAWVGGCQWNAMLDSNRITRDTAEKELRAWLGVDDASFAWSAVDTIGTLQLKVKNYGNTPAYNIVTNTHFSYEHALTTAPGKPTYETMSAPSHGARSNFSKTTSGPGSITSHKSQVRIPLADRRSLDQGVTLVVSGWIHYDDVFKKHRVGTFRFLWGGSFGTQELTWDRQGNEDYETQMPPITPKDLGP